MVGKIVEVIRSNKLYVVLLIFVIFINILAFTDKMARERADKEKASSAIETSVQPKPEEKLFQEDEIKARQKKIEELAVKNPVFYFFLAILNLSILFVLFLGIILDIYFLRRFLAKRAVNIRAISPDEPRWNMADILRVTLIFLSASYIFVLIEAFMTKTFPILNNENFHMVFNTAIINIVGISIILYFVTKKYEQRADAVGLTAKNFLNNIFYAAVGYIAIVPVLILIMVITFFVTRAVQYKPPVQPIVELFMEEKLTSVLWFSASFAAIFGPIAEEIFFRGFIYRVVRKRWGVFWAIVLTAGVFSFLHTHVVGFFPIMALGILLAYLYEKTGSLVAPVFVHIMHNGGMLMLVFLMRYIGA